MSEKVILAVFGAVCLLLVIGAIAIIWSSVRRYRAGSATIEEQGWRRLPDGTEVTAGWDGWPFLDAIEAGKATDIVLGEHRGAQLMTLRWTQREHRSPGRDGADAFDSYNIVALRTDVTYPHLSVIRGTKLRTDQQHAGASDFDTGDERLDRRWQTLGDADFGRAILTPQVRAVIDEDNHAWVFQPGWVTRVVPFSFYGGEDKAIEEVEKMVEPLRSVPAHVWEQYGGIPRFLQHGG